MTQNQEGDLFMREKIAQFKASLGETRTTTNRELFMAGIICLLSGILLGFLFSPIKNGISCGNNNGNTNIVEDKGGKKQQNCSDSKK